MKKILILCFMCMICTVFLNGQTPEKMTYQAVIRNGDGELVTHQVEMKLSILKGDDINSATEFYTEEYEANPNENGLVTLEFGGQGGLDEIDWSSGLFFIKTEVSYSGEPYSVVGTSQLLSVPYALHAKTAERIVGGAPAAELKLDYTPRSGRSGRPVVVSFTGDAQTNFDQASPIAFQYSQATSTNTGFSQASPIYPHYVGYLDSKRVDVEFNIPWQASTTTLDIVINPNDAEPTILEKAFLIREYW